MFFLLQKSAVPFDDLDVGLDTEYPSCMAETASALNQCFKFNKIRL